MEGLKAQHRANFLTVNNNKKGHKMPKAYRKRLAWLMSHGFNVRRMGRGWECRTNGTQINYNREKRAVVRDSFREVALGVGS